MAEETQYNGGGNPVQWKGEVILFVGKGEGGGKVCKGRSVLPWGGLIASDRGDRLICNQIQFDFNSIPFPPPIRFLFDYFLCNAVALSNA